VDLRDAAALKKLAADCGDAGYRRLITARLLRQPVLPAMNRASEAERIAARAIGLCEARGDQLHFSGVINNRRNLLIARKDVASAIADQQQFMRTGRELGIVTNEYFGQINLGELYYYAGDLGAAERHGRRAAQLGQRHPEAAPRAVGANLTGAMFWGADLSNANLSGAKLTGPWVSKTGEQFEVTHADETVGDDVLRTHPDFPKRQDLRQL